MNAMTGKVILCCALGVILGASTGYFYRPSAIFIGQLPFDVVITRGGNLKGLDQIYLEVAKSSFNYMLIGGIAGAFLGALAGKKLTGNSPTKAG